MQRADPWDERALVSRRCASEQTANLPLRLGGGQILMWQMTASGLDNLPAPGLLGRLQADDLVVAASDGFQDDGFPRFSLAELLVLLLELIHVRDWGLVQFGDEVAALQLPGLGG